ncbi:MAG: hypothetical protein B7733_21870 [Myxococcales bacterium FL481]|nr:MAG: hypothetical protein B7733_21870 [Myxococcales bacterium FL481]
MSANTQFAVTSRHCCASSECGPRPTSYSPLDAPRRVTEQNPSFLVMVARQRSRTVRSRRSADMKGVMFNILEEFVVENWGIQAYEDILTKCPIHARGPFVGPGTYPDADLLAIAGAAAKHLGVELADAMRALGEFAFPLLAQKVPDLVFPCRDSLEFLARLDDVVHVEVKKLMPHAVTPSFQFSATGPDQADLVYRSQRRLCPLVEGLLAGVGKLFGDGLSASHTHCVHRGDEDCVFALQIDAEECAA